MDKFLETLSEYKIVPVVKIADAALAAPLCWALLAGGLPVIEITMRTPAALKSIEVIRKGYSGMMVGAGTVLSVDQAKSALDAGASFIISPGFNHKIVEFCLKQNLPVLPGAITPTEIQFLLEYGLMAAKFFPAEQAGGLPMLKALSQPFPAIRFIPTGGIDMQNLKAYLLQPNVLACGGSWMVKEALITGNKFEEIKGLVKEALLATR